VTEGEIAASLDFGRSKDILENKSKNPMTDLLLKITNELIEDWRKELIKNDSYATGGLAASLRPVNMKPESIETEAENHWKYINYGVNGTMVNRGAPTHGRAPKGNLSFYEAIKKWMYDKGINPPQGYTVEQYAAMVKTSIRKKGIEGNHFFDKVLNEKRVDEIRERISNLAGAAIKTMIIKPK
jgi:hypothetical protein